MIPRALRAARMRGILLCIKYLLVMQKQAIGRGRGVAKLLIDNGESKIAKLQRLPDFTQRAAASALSSGRVLKAIAALGAALRMALMTTSNNTRLRGGRRTPAPTTTQS